MLTIENYSDKIVLLNTKGEIMEEKTKILVHRLVWLTLFTLSVLAIIILLSLYTNSGNETAAFWGMFLEYFTIYALAMFIASLFLSYKQYNYNGATISVYAGWYHHALRINGEIFDEHNTLMSFTPIKLSTTLDNGTVLEATISLSNRIVLKINNRVVKPEQKR